MPEHEEFSESDSSVIESNEFDIERIDAAMSILVDLIARGVSKQIFFEGNNVGISDVDLHPT